MTVFCEYFFSIFRKLIRTKPYLITLPATFTASYRDKVKNITVRHDDVWIVTYPKVSHSGGWVDLVPTFMGVFGSGSWSGSNFFASLWILSLIWFQLFLRVFGSDSWSGSNILVGLWIRFLVCFQL